jgi:hypothetical protein
LNVVLISSADVVGTPSSGNPVFPLKIFVSNSYKIVNDVNSKNIINLFGNNNLIYKQDIQSPPSENTKYISYIINADYTSIVNELLKPILTFSGIIKNRNIDRDANIDVYDANNITQPIIMERLRTKIGAIKNAITDITSDQNRNNRNYYFFSQDNYINMYRNRVAFILYYMVFILLAISFYMNRESYSIVMIVIALILFALLPFVIKYITQFAYTRFLGLLKIFYKGNARYIEPDME